MQSMNLEWYRIFLYTARSGSLTKAAQQLHITQPSVSYAIKQLEDALGAKLFDRLSKGVALTREGQSLYDYVEQSFAILDAGEKRLQSLQRLAAGELRIGASGPVIRHMLLPSLDRFHAAYPDVRIRLTQGKTAEISGKLQEGSLDLGMVHLPLADPELAVRPLFSIQDCFVVGEAYRKLAQAGRPVAAIRLAELPLLLLSPGSSTRRFVEGWLQTQGVAAEADIELGSMDMLVEMARRGYGAAFVTRAFVRRELAGGQLFELPLAEPIPPRMIGVASRKAASLPLAAERFMTMLAEAAISE
ncbi:HTH-type transcriptional regulator CynR [Paenibacillus konkukensis]|uniref:HTH-type transcriptional regulator CynR n=2 Tax=Paenibacillus konkukensis TaxID=2020716 RepID=A0ABY4RME7_9BACL|nr:HTH-type transcriptional regulator CynR [Paenibacillus konkukensis]